MGTAADFLLSELRKARQRLEMTQEDFSKLINYSASHVSAVEVGHRAPTREYLAAVDKALDTGGFYTRLLDMLVSLDDAPTWLRDWIQIERQALSLRWYEPAYVPGLLQTEAYARATLLPDGRTTPEQAEQRVRARMERQRVLDREQPPILVAVIDEIVVRRTLNEDRAMMVEQLDHLIACSERPNILIHVIPADTGIHQGLQGNCVIAGLPDGSTVVYLDNLLRAQISDRPAEIADATTLWEVVRSHALPERQSLELIKEAAKSWM